MPPSTDPRAAQKRGILWLASYPKSGNTWTRAFLHNLFALREGQSGEHDINKINEFTLWDISAEAYRNQMGKTPSPQDKAAIAAARPLVQGAIAARTDGLAIVKTHHALVDDRGYPTVNFAVTSGAVYVVRNPLDVAISYAHHMGTDVDRAIALMATKDYESEVTEKSVYEVYGSWSQHVESWTRRPHRAIHIMRYEDMLADPASTFGKLASFLLIPATAPQVGEAIERSSFDRLRKQEDAHGFREKPASAERFFREGRSGQWRERLSRRQVRTVVRDHSAQMAKFGYLDDDLEHLA